jgi:hypothetical protein
VIDLPAVISEVVAGLPASMRRLLRRRVRFVLLDAPGPRHRRLGARPGDRGLFVGWPVRADHEHQGGDLYVTEDGDVDAEGAPELVDAGDGLGVVRHQRPGGTIYLFGGNIPDRATAVTVVLHELAHFFGDDEDDVFAAGLAC